MWFCIFLVMIRGNDNRTYGIGLLTELLLLGLWVLQLYSTALEWAKTDALGMSEPLGRRAATGFFALNA